jgi:ribose-phosphate pyrophosphokinase
MISTGGTLAKAAEALIKRGATQVYTCATHGIFAGDAIRVLRESPIEKVIVTNTLPNSESLLGDKFKVLSIAQILADAIKRITANRSVSELFAKDDESGAAAAIAALDPPVLQTASSATG